MTNLPSSEAIRPPSPVPSSGRAGSPDRTEPCSAELVTRTKERQYETLIEHASEAMMILDAGGHLQYFNPAAHRLMGEPSDSLLGISIPDLVHPDDRPATVAMLCDLMAEPGAPRIAEVRVRQSPGRWNHLEVLAVVLQGGKDPMRVAVIARDLSERRRLEEHLRQTQRMESIGRLAGGVAHDFNNLLTTIGSNCEMLLQDLPPADPHRPNVEEIVLAASRAASLTTQLLAFSRRQVLQPATLDLNSVAAGMERLLRRLLGANIDLQLVPEPSLGSIRADRTQIEQVLLNLAANARDAMPGEGRFTIVTANVEVDSRFVAEHPGARPGAFVALTICDTGAGMDADTLAHVFEPFFTTKDVGKGTGLGLATVYGIVKQSGGYITVQSTVGQGTSFRILLPRVEAALSPAIGPDRGAATSSETQTILLVDDEAAVRRVTFRLLTKLGYSVLEAEDAGRATEIARDYPGPIALVISDVVLPRTRGPALVQQLRGYRPDLRVLFMSGFSAEAVAAQGALTTGAGFIKKPFTIEELSTMVRQQLARGPGTAG